MTTDPQTPPGVPSRRRRTRAVRPSNEPGQTFPAPTSAQLQGIGLTSFLALLTVALWDGAYDLVVRQQIGLAGWWLLALLLLFGVLPVARAGRETRSAIVALVGLVAWTAISLAWTDSAGRTVEEIARVLIYACLAVACWVGLNRGSWRAAGYGLAAAALAVSALAFTSRLAPEAMSELGLSSPLEGRRLAFPLGYWNAVAAWSAMAACIGLALSAHVRTRSVRVPMLTLTPVAVTAIYLTYSRAGVASLVIGGAAVLVLSTNRRTVLTHGAAAMAATTATVLAIRSQPEVANGSGTDGAWIVAAVMLAGSVLCGTVAARTARGRERPSGGLRLPRPLIAAFLAAAVVLTVLIGPSVASRAGGEFARGGSPTTDTDPAARIVSLKGERAKIWSAALSAFGSAPLVGIGPGTFQFWWENEVEEGESLRDAHSLYLETLAELGLIGLALLVGLLATLAVAAFRARLAARSSAEVGMAAGLASAYVVFLFHAGVDWMWEVTAIPILGLGAALIAGAALALPRRSHSKLPRTRAALVLAAVLAGALMIPGLVSENRMRATEAAFSVGLVERAGDLATDAVEAAPWAADPYAVRALVMLARERPGRAAADVRAAIEREPQNWRHRLLLARVQIDSGNDEAALQALTDTARLRPSLADEVEQIKEDLLGGT